MKKAICLFILISTAMPAKTNAGCCNKTAAITAITALGLTSIVILNKAINQLKEASPQDFSAEGILQAFKILKKCEPVETTREEFAQMSKEEQCHLLAELKEIESSCLAQQERACRKAEKNIENFKDKVAENFNTGTVGEAVDTVIENAQESWNKLTACLDAGWKLSIVKDQYNNLKEIVDNQSE